MFVQNNSDDIQKSPEGNNVSANKAIHIEAT